MSFKNIPILLFMFLVLSIHAVAQPGGGDPPDPEVPITGIEVLLAVGGIFGVRKIINSRKRK
jgi:hypothetical protein